MTHAMTREEAEARALADYRAVAGRLIRARDVYCHEDVVGPPVRTRGGLRVRVLRGLDARPFESLLQWSGDWLLAFWNVTPEAPDPGLGGGPCWVDAPAYNVETGEVERTAFAVVREPEPLLRLRWLAEDLAAALRRARGRRPPG